MANPPRGSLSCSIVIFLGSVVSASGSNSESFGLVVGGRILMGFGSTLIETCTSKVGLPPTVLPPTCTLH